MKNVWFDARIDGHNYALVLNWTNFNKTGQSHELLSLYCISTDIKQFQGMCTEIDLFFQGMCTFSNFFRECTHSPSETGNVYIL